MLDISTILDTLTWMSTSDWHLGHKSIPYNVMCDRYRKLFFPRLKDIQLLVVAGDMFDSALSLAEHHVDDILLFLTDLIDECIKNNVTILLMRGTFSHDRDQIRVFYTLAQNKGMGDNCIYLSTISAVSLFGRRFVLLPDDLPYKDSGEILKEVQVVLKAKGWDTVDYVIAHGYFEHVVPVGVPAPKICYKHTQFPFVTRMLVSGHYHTSSVTSFKDLLMLYNGSPERGKHGEEEDKGAWLITDTKGKPLRVQFLKNEATTPFKSYSKDLTEDNAIDFWRKEFESYKNEVSAYLRYTHKNVGMRLAVENLAKGYPNICFTHRSPDDTDKKVLTGSSLSVGISKSYIPTKESFAGDIIRFLKEEKRGEGLTEGNVNTYLEEI